MINGTLFMHSGPDPAADVPIAQVEGRVAKEVERVDRFYQQLVDKRLALPFFTLNEMLQVAAAEIRAVNAIAAAAKEKGEAPNFTGFDLDVLREAAEVVTISDWNLLDENGPLWYRGYATAPEASLREPVAAFLARNKIRRIVVAAHAAADAPHHDAACWQCRVDRHRYAGRRISGPRLGVGDRR